MRFSTVGILAALAAIASAQNPFTRTSYDGIAAGQPEDITWEATTEGTVTLVLMQGEPKALKQVQVIASTSARSCTPDSSVAPRISDQSICHTSNENHKTNTA